MVILTHFAVEVLWFYHLLHIVAYPVFFCRSLSTQWREGRLQARQSPSAHPTVEVLWVPLGDRGPGPPLLYIYQN